MPSGPARRVLAAALPVAAIAFAWAALEVSRAREFALIAALALLAAVPARLAARLGVGLVVLAGTAFVAAGSGPAELRQVLQRGLGDVYAVAAPFAARDHRDLHVLVLLAAATFCLAAAVAAGSHPFAGAAVTAAGLAWPATLIPARDTVAMGALGLLAALWPVLLTGARGRRAFVPGVAMLAGIVVASSFLAGAAARPSAAALGWRSWDLFGESRAGRTVALVWASDYTGLDLPAGKTTVLRVTAPRRALYWRATTLDTFASDRWLEVLVGRGAAAADRVLPADPLLPPAAASPGAWVRQEIEVRALVDGHVIAASQPVRVAAGRDHRLLFFSGGVMTAPRGLGEMRRYTVWSYAPQPTPAALVRSPPAYPVTLGRYLDVGRTMVPPFGTPGRAARVEGIFRDERYQPLWPYRALWTEARRLTERARSPYEATVLLERWLRSDGGFGYDEHPPAASGLPPLVDFATRTKLGYCQHFAGAMTLMLRYLGIPARVAVGFTSGTWKDGAWTVTDHDAHAWVEAWFAGYGWLAFDPTPGRGTLAGTYTNASDSADAVRALRSGGFLDPGTTPPARPGRAEPPRATAAAGTRATWPYLLLPAAIALALAVLALAKGVRRARRASTSDPRRRASAARAELVGFVRDQGSPVSGSAPVSELALELRRLGVASDGFAAAFARARYGPPAGAAAAADETWAELRRVVALLRARLGPGRRARGFLRLRSLRSG